MKIYKLIFILLMLSIIYVKGNAQWEMLSDVFTTAVFVKDSNIFIGTNEGKIYLSTDFGQNWTTIKENIIIDTMYNILDAFYIDNIGICKGNKLICSCGHIIYTSSNWIDWVRVYEVNYYNITAMAIEGDSIYIGAEYDGGIHMSIDNGNSWYDISWNLQNRYITSICVEDTTLILSAYGDFQLFRFNNNLMSWQLFNEGPQSDLIFSLDKGSDFYAGGDDWIFKLESEEWIPVFYTGSNVLDFTFQSSNIFAAGKDVYMSSDSGLTWTTIETTYTNFWNTIAYYDGYILAGNGTGLYRYPILQVSNSNEKLKEELIIYPNPSKDIFYVKVMSISNDNISVNLLSSNGSLIQSKLFIAQDQSIKIDASGLASGLYILQITQGEHSRTKTIIIE